MFFLKVTESPSQSLSSEFKSKDVTLVASQWFKSHGVTTMPWNSRDVSMCVYFYWNH